MKRVYTVITLLILCFTAFTQPKISYAQIFGSLGDKVCRSIPSGSSEFGTCKGCVDGGGTYTAFGCIETSGQGLFATLFSVGMGIAGGIGLLLILFGGFQILTSAGNPERLTAGKEMVWSAIAGLFLIVFSVFLLQLIGFKILGIPGFG